MRLIEKANKIYLENFKPITWFERAIFLSWYCSIGNCKFCYMSTQKNKIKNPKLARRTKASILAEAYLCKKLNWEIEFLSSGYHSYTLNELITLTKEINKLTKKKQWLNIGTLNYNELKKFKPYIKGVNAAIETVNPKIHKFVCPSKPIGPYLTMLKNANKLNLKKSITIIIGLGETINDFPLLKNFIKKYKIDRITFYALNPQKNTIFKKSPNKYYYAEWIAKTRIEFPKIKIIAGIWVDKIDYTPLILKAGANAITKFPSIKLFNSKETKKLEEQIKLANRKFISILNILPKNIEIKEKDINNKLNKYLEVMSKSKN